jgi:tetratricopeptide (TPR) repeat protein
MTERQKEVKITLENLAERRRRQASLREQKGKQEKALEEARAIRERLHEEIVDLYWEEYLIGKHMVMEVRDKQGLWNLPLKVKGIAKGFFLMRKSALKAEKYINEHNVEEKRPRSGRFLGEVEMFSKRYGKAVKHFRRSVELFNKQEDWSQRINALELSGFLAEALILNGKTQKGIDLAKRTFKAYDEGDGERLKENDYYTWAVWKSGCIIKVWHALFAKRPPLTREITQELIQMLDEADKILIISEGEETWGDKNFEMRKDEIEAIGKILPSYIGSN